MLISSELLTWAVGLLVSVLVLVTVTSEIIARLERQESVYTRFWRRLRDLVLPLVAAFLVVRQMLTIEATTTESRILETAVWLVVAYTLGSLLGAAGKAAQDKNRIEASIPGLFRGLLRVIVLGVPAYYILANIWGLQLGDLFAALGVGSLVIALALQDTLSSIVSGFLLTLDKPFDVGDQILIDGNVGTVVDLNWRSVRVRINSRDIIVVPNSQLASQTIYNYTTQDPASRDSIFVGFSYDDMPNDCKRVLLDAVTSSPYVSESPAPKVFLTAFQDASIQYEIVFFIPQFKGTVYQREVRSDIQTRIYYAAKRARLTIPYPIVSVDQYSNREPDTVTLQRLFSEQIRGQALFSNLPQDALNYLTEQAMLHTYGVYEHILRHSEPSDGLYVILSGEVQMLGENGATLKLTQGGICGEMIFWGNRNNLADVECRTDVEAVYLPEAGINRLLRDQPRFAQSLERLVSERTALLQSYAAVGQASDRGVALTSDNGA